MFPLPSRTGGGGGTEFKPRHLISEVRPLMEQNQTEDRRVSWHQDQTNPPNVVKQIQQATDQLQNQVGGEETQQMNRPSPLKKKVQTTVESRRNMGPVARAAASHLNSGLRKAQSVHSLMSDAGKVQNSEKQKPVGLDSNTMFCLLQVTRLSLSQPLVHPERSPLSVQPPSLPPPDILSHLQPHPP